VAIDEIGNVRFRDIAGDRDARGLLACVFNLALEIPSRIGGSLAACAAREEYTKVLCLARLLARATLSIQMWESEQGAL